MIFTRAKARLLSAAPIIVAPPLPGTLRDARASQTILGNEPCSGITHRFGVGKLSWPKL